MLIREGELQRVEGASTCTAGASFRGYRVYKTNRGYTWQSENYDYAPDSPPDNRHGVTVGTLQEALQDILENIEEVFEEHHGFDTVQYARKFGSRLEAIAYMCESAGNLASDVVRKHKSKDDPRTQTREGVRMAVFGVKISGREHWVVKAFSHRGGTLGYLAEEE